MKTEINLQDAFLNVVRQQGQPVTLFLMNGFQMRGIIRGFDSFVVILDVEGRQQMIYKHAISTVVPQHRVDFYSRREDKTEDGVRSHHEQDKDTREPQRAVGFGCGCAVGGISTGTDCRKSNEYSQHGRSDACNRRRFLYGSGMVFPR